LVSLPTHWLKQSLAIGHASEYAHATSAFTPFALVSLETINAFQPLDLPIPCSNSLMKIQLDMDLELPLDSFESTLIRFPHLSIYGPLGMNFKHLQDLFDQNLT
jgi:hypothetical protein